LKHLYRNIFSLFLFILIITSLIIGCTAPSALRGSLAGTVFYTDCTPDEAFDIVCMAVARRGYTVDIKNDFNYFVRAYSNDVTHSKKKNFYVHVKVEPQPVGSKIISRLDEFHDTTTIRFLGIYARIAGKLANEISSSLTKRNYVVQRL